MARSIRPIDVITIAGTGNKIGPFDGMTGLVAKKLDSRVFRVSACQYPATIGRVGAAPGAVPYSLDDSVAIAVKDLAWKVRESPNPVGLVSYSQGGIAAMRFAEAVARGEFRNANGTPLELAFHVGIANPARNAGDHVVPVQGYGLHSSHGRLPAGMVNIELCDPRDIIGATPRFSPLRNIVRGLSPYAALQLNESDPFKSLDAVKSADWFSRIREGSYIAAAAGLMGYLVPYGNPGRTTHTCYSVERVPGSSLTWTDWAAAEINRRWA